MNACPVCAASLDNPKVIATVGPPIPCSQCRTGYHTRCRSSIGPCIQCQYREPAPAPSVTNTGKGGTGKGGPSVIGGMSGAPPSPPARPSPSSRSSWLLLGGGLFAALSLLCALGGGGLVFLEGQSRSVEVSLVGLEADTPVVFRLNTQPPDRVDGGIFHYDSVKTGELNLQVAPGGSCAVGCPGPECSTCCVIQEFQRDLGWGLGAAPLTLVVAPPPPAEKLALSITAPKVDKQKIAYFISGSGSDAVYSTGRETYTAQLLPGTYTVIAVAGKCEAKFYGCGSQKSCPAGCSSWKQEVDLICGAGDTVLKLDQMEPPGVDPEEIRAAVRNSERILNSELSPFKIKFVSVGSADDLLWDITVNCSSSCWQNASDNIETTLAIIMAAVAGESANTPWRSRNLVIKVDSNSVFSISTRELRQSLSPEARRALYKMLHQK